MLPGGVGSGRTEATGCSDCGHDGSDELGVVINYGRDDDGVTAYAD